MLKQAEIKRESWDKLVDFLSAHDKEECIDALGNLTETQAQGLISYIESKKYDLAANELVTLKWVMHDIAGICSGNDMFIPVTRKYQPN